MRTYPKIDTKSRKNVAIDFGIKDEKGRAVGVVVMRADCEMVESENNYGYDYPPGSGYTADVMAARNGSTYGAINPFIYFPSEEAREAWIAKRVDGTKKRYLKKYLFKLSRALPAQKGE